MLKHFYRKFSSQVTALLHSTIGRLPPPGRVKESISEAVWEKILGPQTAQTVRHVHHVREPLTGPTRVS